MIDMTYDPEADAVSGVPQDAEDDAGLNSLASIISSTATAVLPVDS
jgi:hypothetical protein